MDAHIRNYKGQVEINDVIGDAVKNAVARRQEALDSEIAWSALSDEEANSIVGGASLQPTLQPTTIGLVAPATPDLCSDKIQ